MKKILTELKWAFIYSAIVLAWTGIERVSGLHGKNIANQYIFSNLVYIPLTAMYIFALLDKRFHYYKHKFSYLQGFASGLLLTFFALLISPATQLISYMVISPHYFQNAIDYAVGEGKMNMVAANEYYNLQTSIIQNLITTSVFGISASSVISLFTMQTRKNI